MVNEITSSQLKVAILEPARFYLASLIDLASSPLSRLLGNDEGALPSLRRELLEDMGAISYHIFHVITVSQLRSSSTYIEEFKEEVERGYWKAVANKQEAISQLKDTRLKVQNTLLTYTNLLKNLVKINQEYIEITQALQPLPLSDSDFEDAIIQDVNEIVNEVIIRFDQIISLLSVIKIDYLKPFTDLVKTELEGTTKVLERIDLDKKSAYSAEMERTETEEVGRVCEIISGGLNDTIDLDSLFELARQDAQTFIEHTLEIRMRLNDLNKVIDDLDYSYIVKSEI
ncbi:MAG: hypothetical protein ACTSYA_08900 [Candidatus Kariarchaeaceae archaeon]